MTAGAMPEKLSVTYFFLFALASGAAFSAGASVIGIEGVFLPYLGMLIWSAIPFWISRKVFKNDERSWTDLIVYVALSASASVLYPLGVFLPFLAWPVFYAMRRNFRSGQSSVADPGVAGKPSRRIRKMLSAGAISLAVLCALMAVSVWWGISDGRRVKEQVARFCNSVEVGDDAAGLEDRASGALNGNYVWRTLPSGERELFVYKYSSFSKRVCTITAAGGRVTNRELAGQAL